jgi:hypothetical protein
VPATQSPLPRALSIIVTAFAIWAVGVTCAGLVAAPVFKVAGLAFLAAAVAATAGHALIDRPLGIAGDPVLPVAAVFILTAVSVQGAEAHRVAREHALAVQAEGVRLRVAYTVGRQRITLAVTLAARPAVALD